MTAADVPFVLAEGLAQLRRGRAAASAGAVGEADALLASAASAFASAFEADPSSAAAAGNCGNALLARAQLLRAEPLRAEELAVQAGRRFRAALGAAPGDGRALVAWGAALALRAELMAGAAAAPGAPPALMDDAERLFAAAAEKFAAALNAPRAARAPPPRGALAGWGEALAGGAACCAPGSGRRIGLARQAVRRLEDALREDPNDAGAAKALRRADAMAAETR